MAVTKGVPVPEGPEIRRAADRIEKVLAGRVIESISFGLPRLGHYVDVLQGQRVQSMETRGKALLTHFDNAWTIYSHNQLYGVWRVVARDRLPETRRSLRLALHTEAHSALLYSASDISVWPTPEIDQHPFLSRIGPDILSPDLQWREVADRLASAAFRRRRLEALYLDQRFLAGIGNYLRAEILYSAGMNPLRIAASLGRGERGKLARATLEISRRSYATGGITLPPQLAARLASQKLPRKQRRFFVFGREGHPCYRCSAEVARRETGGRRLYWCPGCQPPV
ncbi:MAG: endonuclease VIII [Chromatocurvus sp.]